MGGALKRYGFEPDYAIPPGETLREVMKSLGMSQKELAERTDLTVQSLNRIFKGTQPITYETANRLELATGVLAAMWNNLEAQYREQLARMHERERLQDDLDWLREIPVAELVKRGVLSRLKDTVGQLREVLKFYGVSSVEAWRQIWESPAVAARRSPCFESKTGPASAWIRLGELQVREIDCRTFDRVRFKKALKQIRYLTREPVHVFEPEMRRLCAESGVALALVREMQKVPWNGATKWLTPQKAMILLCLRGKGEDKFWFSFFHEAGHVLHDSKKDLLINDGSQDDPREKRANDFAAEFLIPCKYDDAIRRIRSKEEIVQLAHELGIAPSIAAGRYQFLTGNWHYFKELIRTLEWANALQVL
ncbi:MAG: helix-turn-helix domain-containing protein [Deltaproteobacteria bacterium]|nr:helix-turn-helix domain-containing protein [Deltaproteobacteria bacterium]MBW1736087.1 helix-turn-helix domain-containing protein [Deltaproteobacteria bacterium]MBW1908390.1 helix-turn-helix domain-containing protein [Deltaproteobacteria bacterium]MBW2032418.1 helix-turn-helix domain-containing protein [Deltaproteobacteria bacterium]MBW2113453.1 helix-turn-helix domain-containing protein [Deltaproteobacteria bacterium]